jgi:hypothetical protein
MGVNGRDLLARLLRCRRMNGVTLFGELLDPGDVSDSGSLRGSHNFSDCDHSPIVRGPDNRAPRARRGAAESAAVAPARSSIGAGAAADVGFDRKLCAAAEPGPVDLDVLDDALPCSCGSPRTECARPIPSRGRAVLP